LAPAPSGSWSPIKHYFCDNGYWDIGKGDVVDRKTDGWGQDGVAEKILIKYDSGGIIADRIFIDPEGQQFSGPKHYHPTGLFLGLRRGASTITNSIENIVRG
jgi:hypothetical protein